MNNEGRNVNTYHVALIRLQFSLPEEQLFATVFSKISTVYFGCHKANTLIQDESELPLSI